MWSQLSTTDAHVSYACAGFGLIIIVSFALFLKHRYDFSEVVIATIFGLIVGPHCLNWFTPAHWVDDEKILTLELARIVMNVQIFAASAELPAKYVWKHKLSLFMLLIPVMTFGFMINSLFIWGLLPRLRWVQSLVIAGCVTATDPVLASAVLSGPGFAQSLPRHLVHILSAESASNDGMALPFVLLPVYILLHEYQTALIAKDFIVITVLYQVCFALVLGAVIGVLACALFKFAAHNYHFKEEYMLIYNVVVSVFCAGVGSLLGCDDFLVSFAAGAAFSWSGWSHSNINDFDITGFIDLLLNTAFFIYFGAVVPWEKFNSPDVSVWRLIVIMILILIGRRIPIIALLKPVIPDVKTWKEVLIAGHFGPIGVAAIYMVLEAEEMLLEGPAEKYGYLLRNMWPVVTFMVLCSIIVHGVSVVMMNATANGFRRLRTYRTFRERSSIPDNSIPDNSPTSDNSSTKINATTETNTTGATTIAVDDSDEIV